MKKIFRLEELDCANCAAKMEREINRLEEVKSVTVSFMTQKLTIEAEDQVFETALNKAEAVIKKIEPDCRIIK